MIFHKLTYGLKNTTNKLVYIHEVEKGLNCNCSCPYCKEPLEACKGKVRIHYFRHKSKKDCNGAFESQLHLLSKEIILEHKTLFIPEYKENNITFPSESICFESIQSEVWCYGRKFDLVGSFFDKYGDKQELFIEIRYTHAVDDTKANEIRDANVNCIEIDVRFFLNDEIINKEKLIEFLTKKAEFREWINCNYKKKESEIIVDVANEIRNCRFNIKDFVKQYSDDEKLRLRYGDILFSLYQKKPNHNGYFLDRQTYKEFYNIVNCKIEKFKSLSSKGKQRFISLVQLLYFELVRWDKYDNWIYREKKDAYKDCSTKRTEIENNLYDYTIKALNIGKDLLPY